MGVINTGLVANDGTGDTLRDGAAKVNDAFIDYVAGTITAGSVITSMIDDNAVTNVKIRDSAGVSVIGRSANSSGDPADIVASTDGHILRRSGSVVGFGTVPATSSTFTQTGTGAVAKTVDDKLRAEHLNVFDFMTAAEVADVLSDAKTLDVTAAVQKWLTACLAQEKMGRAPGGTYRCDTPIFLDINPYPTEGLSIHGDGVQTTVFDFTLCPSSPAFLVYSSGGSPAAPVSQAYVNIFDIGFVGSLNETLVQIGQRDYSDYINLVRLRIHVVNYNTGSSTNCLEINACYGGNIEMNGVTGSNPREILTTGALGGGSGYGNGTYTGVPLTGGTGNFATANITVSGGAVTTAVIVSKGFGFTAADVLSCDNTHLGGAGSGFTLVVSTVRVTTSCAIRLRKCSFTYFFLSVGGCDRALHITNDFSYGNTFVSPDFEICDYGVLIDSASAANNVFIAGTYGYYLEGIRGTAGSNNIAINPNVNSAAPFITAGVGITRFDQTTMAPKASPTFTGIATAPTFTASSTFVQGAATVVDASAGFRFPLYTAANIADKTHAVNTADKVAGKAVYDLTNTRIMVAAGSADVSAWKVCDNSATVTPA